MRKATLLYALVLGALLFTACKDDDKPPASAFDRGAMLEHYADELIVPAYGALQQRSAALQTAVQQLVQTPSATTLQPVRAAWTDAFLAWQDANAFNFGPAGEAGVRKSLAEEIGTFPAGTAKIQAYAAAGDTAFNNFDRDTRGFLALDYLLFAGTDDEVIARLADANYRAYVLGVTNHLARQVDAVAAAWNGSYRDQFIANDGTDVGSSTSELYNEFVRSYELLKNFKVGLPLGKRIGQTATEPEKVEAYYSGESLAALQGHFTALVRLWEGRGLDGTDGPGFREYLAGVEGGPALIQSTESQIDVIQQELIALGGTPPLSERIATDPASLEPLFNALTQHTRFFKSDMSSLLGIYITYSSGDGD